MVLGCGIYVLTVSYTPSHPPMHVYLMAVGAVSAGAAAAGPKLGLP